MTPQEKAKELVEKMINTYDTTSDFVYNSTAKECALIAVDEIEKAIDFDWMEVQNLESEHRYWEQVKAEIEKL